MSENGGGPSFWLLNQALCWRETEARDLLFGPVARLAPLPGGPLGLASPDGSLGGRTLPRTMALDDELCLYLLVPGHGVILKYDARKTGKAGKCEPGFNQLRGIGGPGHGDREFCDARSILIAGKHLYVADTGNRCVKVFGLDPSLPLLHVLGPDEADPPCRPAPLDRPRLPAGAAQPPTQPAPPWQPVDVAEANGQIYILDAGSGDRPSRLFRHRRGSDRLVLIPGPPQQTSQAAGQAPSPAPPPAPTRWTRVAGDIKGRVALFDTEAQPPTVDIYDPCTAEGQSRWSKLGPAEDADQFFGPAPLRVYQNDRPSAGPSCVFVLPACLAAACGRARPTQALPTGRPAPGPGDLVFDLRGRPVARLDAAEWLAPPIYAEAGSAIIGPLDSRLFRCQWHRLALDLADLPPGTRIDVRTIAAADKTPPPILKTPLQSWSRPVSIFGPPQAPDAPVPEAPDVLVQTSYGQYLWIRLDFAGDGFRSPQLKALRAYYPRRSYLGFLPAIYSMDDTQRSFLERFLAIFQTTWDEIEQQVAGVRAYFDPDAAPAKSSDLMALAAPNSESPLTVLARWLALPLEDTWTVEQKRALLRAMPEFFNRGGTPGGVQRLIGAYLDIVSGQRSAQQSNYPVLIEGFHYRHRIFLNQARSATFGDQIMLWGPEQVGRLQLDAYAQVGQARIVSTADPARDVFHEYAHRFRLFVPSGWVVDANAERMLRRGIETAKPAQAAYELCLVEPRFRVGVQSTVGIDTIVGDIPALRLTSAEEADKAPPSRPPRHRLGYDSVLSAAPAYPPDLKPAAAARIGADTVLK